MSNYIEETLSHLRNGFIIEDNGSSQTSLANKGRVGLFVERLFGIDANKSRKPDFGEWELKTVKPATAVSIGTMPLKEFTRIKNTKSFKFDESDPYAKMKKTIFVYYDRVSEYPQPFYVMHGWGVCQIDKLSNHIVETLNRDYTSACKLIQDCDNYDDLTYYLRNYGSGGGKYLSLTYKGDRHYIYPSWKFSASFMNAINN